MPEVDNYPVTAASAVLIGLAAEDSDAALADEPEELDWAALAEAVLARAASGL
jgi:hypothetical protein